MICDQKHEWSVLQSLRNYQSLSMWMMLLSMCTVHVCYQRPVFTRHVRITTAAGLSVSRHLKTHLRCSSVVGFFDVCWSPALRDSSSSCSIWSVGVCDDSRGTSWRCWWTIVFKSSVLCIYHVLEELLPPKSDSQHNLRKRRHNITLPEKKGLLAAKNFIIRLLYKDPTGILITFFSFSVFVMFSNVVFSMFVCYSAAFCQLCCYNKDWIGLDWITLHRSMAVQTRP